MKPAKSEAVRLCVNLDADLKQLPEKFFNKKRPQLKFNQWLIKETASFATAYKFNTAFYEAEGIAGWQDMQASLEFLQDKYPEKLSIADAKRADIANTNDGYVKAFFDDLGFDAITLNPYLGQEALASFLAREDKICILLAKTSNPGSGEFQDLPVQLTNKQEKEFFNHLHENFPAEFPKFAEGFIPLWQHVVYQVAHRWGGVEQKMLVIGATYPLELRQARLIAGEKMWFLVPGVGVQGGEVREVLQNGSAQKIGEGVLISVGRSIIFNDAPAQVAKDICKYIN